MKKIIIALFVLIGIVIAAYYYTHKPKAALPATDVYVSAITLKAEDLPIDVKVMANVVAPTIKVTPEVAGHVDKILFNDGQKIQSNALLVQLDNALEKAKYTSAKAQLDYSETNYKRALLLGKRGAVSQKSIEESLADFNAKKAFSEESIALLNKMELRAPFAGVIGRSKISVGAYVNAGDEIATLTDTQHIRVEYSLPEHYRPLLRLGQDVSIVSPTYPDQRFNAKLAYISPTINQANRSLMLYASLSQTNDMLIPGMFVSVIQSLGNKKNALMIPARSLLIGAEGPEVFKVVEGKALATKVRIGERQGEYVQVLAGLQEGDQVLTDGQLKVKNAMPVKIVQSHN